MPNLIKLNEEAAITWRSTGGTELFTPTSLLTVAGRQGALHDFTVAARSDWFHWRAFLKPGATRVLKEQIRIYIKTSDGTHPDNDDGVGDIAVSTINKLDNLHHIGTLVIDEDAAVEMVKSGDFRLGARWAGPVFWNATANTLSATAADFGFDMTPTPLEIQATA